MDLYFSVGDGTSILCCILSGVNTLFSWYVGHREAVELWGQEPGSCSLMRLTSSTRAHILCSQSHHSSGSVVSYIVFIQYIMGKPIVGYSALREKRKRLEG